MRFPRRFWFIFAAVISLFSTARGQEKEEEFYLFKDKDGKQVEAQILSVTEDNATMKIAVRDGREYDIPLSRLILSDQLHVKQWIEAKALVEAKAKAEALKEEMANRKYEMFVTFQKRRETEQRQQDSEHFLGLTSVVFSIGIKNSGPDPAPPLTVEHLVLTRQGVTASQEGDIWKWQTVEGATVNATYRKETTPAMKVNDMHQFETPATQIDEVFSLEKERVAGDEVLGMFLRVTNPQGKEIAVVRTDEGLETYNWDSAVLLSKEGPGARVGGFVTIDGSGALVVEMRQGQTQPSENVDIRGRRMDIKVQVTPDPKRPQGVIAAHGDAEGGWALYAHEGKLILLFKTKEEAKIETTLPEKQFGVTINFDSESLILRVDRENVGELHSPGLFTRLPEDPLCVGFDEGTPLSPDYLPPAAFPGKVEGFSLRGPPVAGE